jgi:TetR/AcrR family transcriptional regulator, repressor of fatR-cypB operon
MANQEKREAILQAALLLFAERGFHNTPMSLIVKQSGASAGTIYLHFADKDDLIHTLYRHVKGIFYRAMVVGHGPDLPHNVAFRLMWLNTYHFYVTHHIEAQFLDHYENSPYYRPELPVGEKVEEEANLPALSRLMVDDAGQAVTKDLPVDALFELSMGVAVRLAKNRRAGMPALNERELEAIVDACYQAVMR